MSYAPLPFQGNKRNYKKLFIEGIKNRYSSNNIFIDLFGGSGILSDAIKKTFPTATVIYNDYDDYTKRLNEIPETNNILNDIREIIGDVAIKQKIDKNTRLKIIDYLRSVEQTHDYVDWITISAYILFSGNYADSLDNIIKQNFFNRIPGKQLDKKDYLEGVETTHDDYKILYNKYKDNDNAVFILDPPYLASDKHIYTDKMWDLNKYLDLFDILHNAKNWVFFCNGESFILDLLKYIDKFVDNKIFDKAEVFKRVAHNSGKAKYTDIMIFK